MAPRACPHPGRIRPQTGLYPEHSMQLGIFYALLAYIIWGLLSLYIKSLHGVGPLEILLHRQ